MNKLIRSVLLLTVIIQTALSAKAQDTLQIDKEYVSNNLKSLSSDDLKGRKVFSEGIEKAADIIVEDFETTGLSFIPGLNSFRQEFEMYQVITKETIVQVEGVQLNANQYFGFYNSERINWSQDNELNVLTISGEENFQQAFTKIRTESEIGLVFVDKAHETIFTRYQQYFAKGSTKFELNEEKNLMFVLTDNINAKTYKIDVLNSVEERKLANIAGIIEGNRKDEIVLFSAHYDHIGILEPIEGDSIANGANDDASGTTAVMALANYYKGKNKPERTIYFVAFTAEEVGGFGSQYFSKQLNPEHIVAMFNIEMIGKPAVEGPNTAWVTGFDKSSFGSLLQKSVEGTAYKFYADPYPDQNLFYRSDNATLARLGVPAHSISTTPIDVDKDYHQVSDEFETIDIDHLTNTINAIAKAAEGIIAGLDTPTRVDKSMVE